MSVSVIEDEEFPPDSPKAKMFGWIPGASTAKAAYNYATGNHVANAVKFTKENVTFLGAVTGGSSLVAKVTANPIKASSLLKIAEDDNLWKEYCDELSKTNTFVPCNSLRNALKKFNKRPNPQSLY
jgi:hypothetical protein